MIDERLNKIEAEKQNAINSSNNMYQGLINNNKELYDKQLAMSNEYETTQNQVLDKQLENNLNKIEQQKQKAQQNFETESKKAKNDYTSFINPYGYQAESMASQGLNNSGVSETSKLGGWNTYQNRLANANKVMQDAFVSYDNDMNDARLNNDVQKAQNALEKLKLNMQYTESYYNKDSDLQQNRFNTNLNVDNNYYNRYQDTVSQINYEKEKEEARRQYEEQFAYQKQQDALAQANWEKEYALSQSQLSASKARSSSGRSSSKSSSKLTNGSSSSLKSSSTNNSGSGAASGSILGNLLKNNNSDLDTSKMSNTGKRMGDLQMSISGVANNAPIMKLGNKYYVSAGNDRYVEVSGYYEKRFK